MWKVVFGHSPNRARNRSSRRCERHKRCNSPHGNQKRGRCPIGDIQVAFLKCALISEPRQVQIQHVDNGGQYIGRRYSNGVANIAAVSGLTCARPELPARTARRAPTCLSRSAPLHHAGSAIGSAIIDLTSTTLHLPGVDDACTGSTNEDKRVPPLGCRGNDVGGTRQPCGAEQNGE